MTPRDQEIGAVGVVAVVLCCYLAAAVGSCVSSARAEGGEALLLAQAAWAECGWDSEDCHAASMHMHGHRAEKRRRSLSQAVRDYCAAWDPRAERQRARLARSLRADLARPEHWPRHLSWARHRPRWSAILDRARAFLIGDLGNPCNGRPWHMGADYGIDKRRAARAGWVRLDCGDTGRQAFYGRGRTW